MFPSEKGRGSAPLDDGGGVLNSPTDPTKLEIAPEDPSRPPGARLLEELLEEQHGHYPKEFVHGFDPSEVAGGKGVFLVARLGGRPVGCGALRPFEDEEKAGEIKRMYVRREARRLGVGRRILEELESAARDRGLEILRLETGDRQPEAMGLYEAFGYRRIPPFGEYVDDPYSVCYEKTLP